MSLVPFVTAWMGENNFAAWPVALYDIILVLAAVAYFILVRAMIALHGQDSVLANAVGRDFKGNMKKLIALAFPFLVLVTIVATLAWLEARRTPSWEIVLNDYMTRGGLAREPLKIQAAVEASRPWNFTAAMGEPVGNDWPWGIDRLPFPPTAMRCVLLEKEGELASAVEGEPKRRVIYVGYHDDTLWRAGWLVNESPKSPFTPELVADLATIGCDLGTEEQINDYSGNQ